MSETAVKKEPGLATLVLVLFAISAIVALLLGVTNMITKPYIDANAEKTKQAAMAEVLPADGYEEVEYTGGDGHRWTRCTAPATRAGWYRSPRPPRSAAPSP